VNTNENSKKWDRYRDTRVLYQDVAIRMVKDQVRVKLWLSLALNAHVIRHLDTVRQAI
jgi:hypothetical protein